MPENLPPDLSTKKIIFRGDSKLANLMREYNWEETELGSPENWPLNLRMALNVCLTSHFPMTILWGPNLIIFYNDAYGPLLGPNKNPHMLGKPAKQAWPEIWDIIKPLFETVLNGTSTWAEDMLFFIDRNLKNEECHFSFSYSPIYSENKTVDGIFVAIIETTSKIIDNRRLETLKDLSIKAAGAQSFNTLHHSLISVLKKNSYDIPFAAIYSIDNNANQATLINITSEIDNSLLPASIALTKNSIWPLATVLEKKKLKVVNLKKNNINLHAGPWPEPILQVIVLPIFPAAQDYPKIILICGISTRQILNKKYCSFFNLIASHIGVAINNAHAYENEHVRANKLAELDQVKTVFFNNISHEFRTPLTLIIAPLENLLKNWCELPEDHIRSDLMNVHKNALRLLKLVNSFLEFSAMEVKQIQANFQLIDISKLTADLVGYFRSIIEAEGIKFTFLSDRITQPVYVDLVMWEKIIFNLISNAFKHTFTGVISILIKARKNHLELIVADTGIGIEEKHVPRLFERFYRIEEGQARSFEGSGIGLAIVNDFVHLHGGKIRVDSKIGKGSQFIITIPYGREHLSNELVEIPADKYVPSNLNVFINEMNNWLPTQKKIYQDNFKYHILVVDDNNDMRDYIARVLSQRWNVDTVADGATALTTVHQKKYDLILLDIMLPKLNGFNFLRTLRKDEELKHIPIIMFSAKAGENACIEGLEAGADDYLIKPFSIRELLARVETHLKLSERYFLAVENKALKELQKAAIQLIKTRNISAFLQGFIDAAISLAQADMGNIQLFNSQSKKLHLVAHKGLTNKFIEHFNFTDKETLLSGKVVKDLKYHFTYDVTADAVITQHPSFSIIKKAGIRSVLALPILTAKNKLAGLLCLYWKLPHSLNETTTLILDLLAYAAAALIKQKQYEENLYASKKEAENKNHSKDLFLATLSHELRTPLTAILSWIQLLQTGNLSPEKIKLGLNSIEENALTQNIIISDLLDISRIVLGKICIDMQPCNLVDILCKAVNSFRPIAEKKLIQIKYVFPGTPIIVSADPIRLWQIFCNILSNAVKFTSERGHIEIKMRIVARNCKKHIYIYFKDDGIGIKQEFVPHIFSLFSQANTARNPRDGLGIGLALVYNLLQMQGGSIEVQSEGEKKGATFKISLPLFNQS